MIGNEPRITREYAKPLAEAGHLAELFALLGDPSRMQMLYALLEAGELSIEELAADAGVSLARASHAMRLLRTARVVRSRRTDRSTYYNIRDRQMRVLLELAGSATPRNLGFAGLSGSRSRSA